MTTNTRTKATAGRASNPVKVEGLTSEQRVGSEQAEAYGIEHETMADAEILERAEQILRRRFEREATISEPRQAGDWLRVRMAGYEAEVFACVFMDHRHRVIAFEELFTGTLDGAIVYPREVVRACIKHNAGAVILAHFVPRNIMRLMCP